jgi:hypothetical protein
MCLDGFYECRWPEEKILQMKRLQAWLMCMRDEEGDDSRAEDQIDHLRDQLREQDATAITQKE